jgi:hypothetical protein
MFETPYGRRKDDIIMADITPEFLAGLTDSQKVHINLLQSVNSMNTAINDLNHKVLAHEVILVTSSPSLQDRVRVIEEYLNSLKFWGRAIGLALLAQTIAFIGGIVVAIYRFLPVLERLAQQQP